MKAIEHLERLKRLNEFIKREQTGTPEEFSRKLKISRRQLYFDLDMLRDFGVDTGYSKQRQTFFFCNGHELKVSYVLKAIPRETQKEINGGMIEKRNSGPFYPFTRTFDKWLHKAFKGLDWGQHIENRQENR